MSCNIASCNVYSYSATSPCSRVSTAVSATAVVVIVAAVVSVGVIVIPQQSQQADCTQPATAAAEAASKATAKSSTATESAAEAATKTAGRSLAITALNNLLTIRRNQRVTRIDSSTRNCSTIIVAVFVFQNAKAIVGKNQSLVLNNRITNNLASDYAACPTHGCIVPDD